MSVPISLNSTSAVVSSIPSIAVRSTPHTQYSRARALRRGSLASRFRRRGRYGNGWPALRSANVRRWASMAASQSLICR